MTNDRDDGEGRDDRLAALTEALREHLGELTADRAQALAERFALHPDDVFACHRALAALGRAIVPVAPAGVDATGLPDTYELLGELGRGGMGVVYRARHRALGREVAIKVLQTGEQLFQELLRRFEVEARSLARLRHPHIVAVHDVGKSHGHVYYTMDLIEGTSLDRVLSDDGGRDGALSPSRAVRILQQVASAIEHSHEHGVIHRDLKPANILLDRSDTAFVADFGLARDRTVDVGLTTTGQIMGTPAYMSPEAMRGDHARIGERSDIWALGAVLYQALCGTSPFARKNLADTMHAVLHDEPVPLRRRNPRVPRDLELVCHKALAKSPDERYATARALREDLERFQQGLPVLAQRPSLHRRFGRFAARNRGGILGALATATAVALAMLLLRPQPDSPEVIDAMIQKAGQREAQQDFAGAAEAYEHARGVLGADAHRSLRDGRGNTSDALIDQIWRGLLRCQAELAWQRVGRGEAAAAAAGFAAWMARRPADAGNWSLALSQGELSALQAVAGDVPTAFATLTAAAPRSQAWSTVRRRLQPIWEQPDHPSWRTAGALLALAVAATHRDPGAVARLDGGDASTALAAAWAHAESLPPPGRDVLRERLRRATFGAETPLQWGGPKGDTVRALATLAADRTLASSTRLEALDVLCALVDLPWRPGATDAMALAGPRGQQALTLAEMTVQLPRDDAWRRRLDLAVALLAERRNDPALRLWLAGTTGVDATTDFASWWPAHRDDDLAARLELALGDEARHDPGPAMAARFGRLGGVQRRRYHLWLCLRAPAGQPTPVWPAFEPEPDNLVATWQLGVRPAGEQTLLQSQVVQWNVDGRSVLHGALETRQMTLDEPLRTWSSSTAASWFDSLLPNRAFAQRLPEFATCLPGVGDPNQAYDLPSRRVDLEARLQTQDQLRLTWTAELTSQPAFHARLAASAPQALGQVGLRLIDVWNGGHEGETSGPCLIANGAYAARPGTTGGLPEWSTTCQLAIDAAARSDRDDLAGLATRLGIGAAGAAAADALDVVAKIPLANVIADLLPRLRLVDATARACRDDPRTMTAWLAAANAPAADAARTVRGRLAAPLAARLVNGDATAVTEPAFAERLAEAEAGLGLDLWWWYRVFVGAAAAEDAAAVRDLALARLAAAPLPTPLLLAIANAAAAPTLPDPLAAQVERLLADRARQRWFRLAPLGALAAATLLAAIWAFRRLRRRPTAVAAPAALLAATGLALFVVDVRFGVLRLPPASPGLCLLALAALLLLRQRRTAIAMLAVVTTAAAALAGFAADARWHPFASAIAGIASAFALALLALQFGAAARLLRLAWVPAVLFAAAGAVGASIGIDLLASGREVDSFRAAVEASAWAGLGRGTSAVGCAAMSCLLGLVAVRRDSATGVDAAPAGLVGGA